MMINSLASVTYSSKRPEQNETVHCEQNRHKYRTWVLKAEILPCSCGKTDSAAASHLKTRTNQLLFMLTFI